MTGIIITDNVCWLCGEVKNDITKHHALSQHLKPKHNVQIPICKKCHDEKINASDITAMQAFSYKLVKTNKEMARNTIKLKELLQTYLDKKDIEKQNGEQNIKRPLAKL